MSRWYCSSRYWYTSRARAQSQGKIGVCAWLAGSDRREGTYHDTDLPSILARKKSKRTLEGRTREGCIGVVAVLVGGMMDGWPTNRSEPSVTPFLTGTRSSKSNLPNSEQTTMHLSSEENSNSRN